MGQLIKLKTSTIKPSQNFLKKKTVAFILDCYNKGEIDSLPPVPIVRQYPNIPDVYIAIDGHNVLAVNEFLGIDGEVYLVNSMDDYLPNPESKESISQRNKDLADKFESCVSEADTVNCSFAELVKGFIAQQHDGVDGLLNNQ